MKNINWTVFGVAFFFFAVLTGWSFLGAFSYDDGFHTSGNKILNDIFSVMFFPIAYLVSLLVPDESVMQMAIPLGVLADITLYSLSVERMFYFFRRSPKPNK